MKQNHFGTYKFWVVGSFLLFSIIFFQNCSSKDAKSTGGSTPQQVTPKIVWQKYTSDVSQSDIWSMNLDGSEATNLTPNTAAAIDFDVQWSADHSTLVFTSTRGGSPDIYKMNADGSNVTQLTSHAAFETFGSFSTDGTKIVFTRTLGACADVQGQIHIMNSDGSNVTPVAGSSCDEEPDFSPDGTKILFDSDRSGHYQLYVMDIDGSNVVQLTNTAGTIENRYPQWSPDGTKIVFGRSASSGGPTEIYTINANGTGLTQLTNNAGVINSDPSWSSDGTQIVFPSTRNGGGDAEIYIMNADGSNETRLTTDAALLDAGPFAW